MVVFENIIPCALFQLWYFRDVAGGKLAVNSQLGSREKAVQFKGYNHRFFATTSVVVRLK